VEEAAPATVGFIGFTDTLSIAELLRSQDTTRLGETKYSQPVCTALQLAIVTLLEAWGIKPIATVGHSSGEIAAAYAAGILSFENAIIAAYYRGLYMSNGSSSHLTVRGAMMAVGLTEAETAIELSTYDGRLAIAAVNSHSSITISGDEDAIIDLKAKLQARKIFARQLHVAQAFHSHHMLPLAAGYQGALESHPDFMALPATCRMFSSVTARVADHRRMGAEYWVANMTGTVRFSDALTGILLDDVDAKNVDVLVEIGPHPALKGPCRQVMASLKTEVPYLPSLTRGTPDYEGLVDTAGQLFAMGYSVDLAAVNSDIWRTADGALSKSFPATRLRDIPSYSWDHSSYWAECRLYRDHRLRRHRHTLLGAPVPGSIAARPRWRNFLRPKEIPWLLDHQIEGRTIFPAAGYIATAIEAVTRIEGASRNVAGILLRDVTIKSALALSEHDAGREVIFELRPATVLAGRGADIWYEFSFFSYHDNGQSQENCHGFISIQCGASSPAISSTTWPELHEIDKRTDRSISAEKYYAALHMLGLQYGPLFRLLSGDVEAGQGLAVARLSFRPADCGQLSADACILHPALLDAAFHPIFAGLESLGGQSLDAPYVPTFLRSMRISGKLVDKAESGSSQQHYRVCSAVKQSSPRVAVAQLQLQSEQSGEILVEMEGLETKALGKADSADGVRRSLFFRLRWQPAFSLLGDGAEVLALDDIADIIDVFAHQYPNSNILHLTSDLDSTKAVLKYLGGRGQMRRRFASLTVHSATVSASLGQMAAEWSGLVKVQEPREGDYDLVIVTAKSEVCVKSLLRPGGYAITSPTQPFMEDMTVMFKTSRLLVWQATADRAGFMGELAIIRSSRVSEQCRAIASILRPHTGPLSEMTIDEVVDDAVQLPKNIVVMAGVGEALFNSPSEQEHHFEFAKKLLTQTDKNIVWVVKVFPHPY
jgi:acyl transferase domain-containing protein